MVLVTTLFYEIFEMPFSLSPRAYLLDANRMRNIVSFRTIPGSLVT